MVRIPGQVALAGLDRRVERTVGRLLVRPLDIGQVADGVGRGGLDFLVAGVLSGDSIGPREQFRSLRGGARLDGRGLHFLEFLEVAGPLPEAFLVRQFLFEMLAEGEERRLVLEVHQELPGEPNRRIELPLSFELTALIHGTVNRLLPLQRRLVRQRGLMDLPEGGGVRPFAEAAFEQGDGAVEIAGVDEGSGFARLPIDPRRADRGTGLLY